MSDTLSPPGPRRRRRGVMPWWVYAAGGLVAVATLVGLQYAQRARTLAVSTAETKVWTLVGPPCAPLTGAAFAQSRLKPDKAFIFNDIRFERRFGHVDCSVVRQGEGLGYGPVCQFTGPAVLTVVTPRGSFHFEPGAGRPATVSVENGQPRCILAGNFGAH